MGAAIGEEEGEREVKVGSIVWVRRKNGIWWPGRVMSPSDSHFSFTATRAKIKLLGRDNSSVDWYNLESSRCIKAFRCGEFDDCITKAESSKALAPAKNLKYARENAILHALELESQVLQKKLKRPGSEMQQESCSKAKRSKRVYFTLESRDCSEQSVQSHSSKGSPNPFHAAAENTFEPMESDSSDRENKERMRNSKAQSDISESSVDDKTAGSAILKKCKPKRKLSIQQVCRRPLGPDDDRSCVLDYTGEKKTYCYTNETLTDVQIKVQASYRRVHVPLVSMMSRLNGKAIIGHPVNIQVLKNEKLLNSNMGRSYPLVWKTSKRTPVIYAPPLSSTCEDRKSDLKKQQISNWSRKAYNADSRHTTMQKAMEDGTSRAVACIPVKHIFSKLLVAVSKA